MLKNYIVIALRSFLNQKFAILINILGIGIASACCIVAYLNWQFNSGFDAGMSRYPDIYRINSIQNESGSNIRIGTVPLPLGRIASANIPEIEKTALYIFSDEDIKIKGDIFLQN